MALTEVQSVVSATDRDLHQGLVAVALVHPALSHTASQPRPRSQHNTAAGSPEDQRLVPHRLVQLPDGVRAETATATADARISSATARVSTQIALATSHLRRSLVPRVFLRTVPLLMSWIVDIFSSARSQRRKPAEGWIPTPCTADVAAAKNERCTCRPLRLAQPSTMSVGFRL
jgi:hypothetical protein